MATPLIIFLLFVLPLIVFPFGASYFDTPKIFLAQAAIDLGVVCFILKTRSFRDLFKPKRDWILIAFFILSLIPAISQADPTAFFGNPFRLHGVFIFWHLLLLAWWVSKLPLKINNFSRWAALSLVGLALGALLILPDTGRVVSTLGEPNALAAAVVFLWPFVVFSRRKTAVKLFAVILSAGLIVFSGSRSGLVAMILQLVVLGTDRLRFSKRKIVIVVGALFLCTLLLPFYNIISPYEDRATIWLTAFQAGWAKPLFGWGYGQVETALSQTARLLGNNLRFVRVDSAHNIFLDFWIQGGLIGLLMFLVLVCQSFRSFLGMKSFLFPVLLIGVLSCLSFNPGSVYSLVVLWWLLGAGLNVSDRIDQPVDL